MKIGYARVSTASQNLDMQLDALQKAGCEQIFVDKLSGRDNQRPEFMKMNDMLRRGDQVVVFKLDRLGRSVKNLITIVESYGDRGIDLHSVHEAIDTASAGGKLFFHIIAAFAHFEADIISERTKEGLKAARARGKFGGRPKVLSQSEAREVLNYIYKNPSKTVEEVLALFKLSRSSYYRHVLPLRRQDEAAYESGVKPASSALTNSF